jgi:hypothetical protein
MPDPEAVVVGVLVIVVLGAVPCWVAVVAGLVAAHERAARPLQLAVLAAVVAALPLPAQCLWGHQLAASLGYSSRWGVKELLVYVGSWLAAGVAELIAFGAAAMLAARARPKQSVP